MNLARRDIRHNFGRFALTTRFFACIRRHFREIPARLSGSDNRPYRARADLRFRPSEPFLSVIARSG